jgi:hypothetical protein
MIHLCDADREIYVVELRQLLIRTDPCLPTCREDLKALIQRH